MSSKKNNIYYQILNQALKHYHDVKWLGEECPLASLYFAGDWIDTDHAILTPEMRGEGLQKMLRTALDDMWVGEKIKSATELHEIAQESFVQDGRASLPYQYLLLELRYFRHIFPSRSFPQTNQEFLDFLGVSRSHFFDHLKYAVNTLGDFLLQLSQPTFRLERPSHQTDYIGRATLVDHLHVRLQQGESAAISGVGGIGKTSLGRLVSQKWELDDVFWYTIRPRITDHVESLIYALGAFLQKKTESRSLLWKQLMSGSFQNGQIELYLGLLRQELELLNSPILLCFDEVDLLQTDVTSERGVEHRTFLFLLENLSDSIPVLLIGQHIPLDTIHHTTLRPLDLEQTTTLVTAKSDLSDEDIQTIHTATRGIPRLIELALALYQTDESLTSVVNTLSDSASAHAVMGRLWNRLDADEQETLTILSVSQGGLPTQLLPEIYQQKLPKLMQRTLINSGSNDDITLDELIRRLVYRRSSRQQRDQSHLIVADIRYTLGEYTMSAYHYAQAEAHDLAIELWFPYKDREIERGHAQRARDIFLDIPSRHLSKKQHKQLQVIHNQLCLLTGDAGRVIKETKPLVETAPKQDNTILHSELRAQLGDAYRLIDNVPDAIMQYEKSLDEFIKLSENVVMIADRLNALHIRTGNLDKARKQLNLIRAYSEYAHGRVESGASNFQNATVHFENALSFAELADSETMMATAEQSLALLAGYAGDIEKSSTYYERAAARFSNMDDIVYVKRIQSNTGMVYAQSGNHHKVIEILESVVDFFRNINDTYTVSVISYNLSEAYFHIGEIDMARTLALRVLHFEVPEFQPYAFYTLGLVEQSKQHPQTAIDILKQGIEISKSNRDKYIESYLLRGMAGVFADLNDQDSSLHYYQHAVQLFEEMGMTAETEATRLMFSPTSEFN